MPVAMHWPALDVIARIGRGFGLLFGAAFFLLVDEGANTLLGIMPSPQRFPWQAHPRGLAGHLVYGAAADTLLKGADRARAPFTDSASITHPKPLPRVGAGTRRGARAAATSSPARLR